MSTTLQAHPPQSGWYTVHLPPGSPALQLDRLGLSFGGVDVLKDLSLDIRAGDITAIIGPNGAGKSSLLNVLSGLYLPQQGVMTVFGNKTAGLQPGQAARLGIGRTFQHLALFGGLSVAENLQAGRHLRLRSPWWAQWLGLPGARREQQQEQQRIGQLLAFLGLEAYRDRPVSSLPYGVQKRVDLARALASEPRVLLLDEPMAGMNRQEKQQLSADIRTIRDQCGTTVVLIEHDIQVVWALADHVVALDYGRKIADGDPQSVARHPEVLTAYLGQSPVSLAS